MVFHPLESLLFVGKKLIIRFFYHGYGLKFYPDDILEMYSLVNREKVEPKWVLGGKNIQYNASNLSLSLFLASESVVFSAKGDQWGMHFSDSEDMESLHRWNWLLYLLGDKKIPAPQRHDYILTILEKWSEKNTANNMELFSSIWEPYTVGERISNSVIYFHLADRQMPDWLLRSLVDQTYWLLDHLEYYAHVKFNHVVNNARALYLAGVAFCSSRLRNFAISILTLELNRLVTIDGFLREGSSHYQFIFTRWILEVRYFANLFDDHDMLDVINPYAEKLLRQCLFFLQYNEDTGIEIPLIGDISPDFTPDWIKGLPFSRLSQGLLGSGSLLRYKKTQLNDINSVWEYRDDLNDNVLEDNSVSFIKSGWYKLVFDKHSLYVKSDSVIPVDYAGHHHEDIFHFNYFYCGEPILVDHGRLNYKNGSTWSDFGVSPKAHNSILVDDLGAVPHLGSFPPSYSKIKNCTEITEKEDSSSLTLESTAFSRVCRDSKVTRKLCLKQKELLIEDNIILGSSHEVKLFFHFSKKCELVKINNQEWLLKYNGCEAAFKTEGNIVQSQIYLGGEEPMGWEIDHYGKISEAPTLEINYLCNKHCVLLSTLEWLN